MAQDEKLQWLVVGGCPRSGTTALLGSLNAHPDVGLIPEYNLETMLRTFDSLFSKERYIHDKKWVGDVNVQKRGGNVDLFENQLQFVPQKHKIFHKLLRNFFELTMERPLRVAGEKTPFFWELNYGVLDANLGPVKTIIIVRHPMAVANSFMHRRNLTLENKDVWKINDIFSTFKTWANAWNQMLAFKRNRGNLVLTIKYEDFFDHRERTEHELEMFLGLSPGKLLPFSGRKDSALDAFRNQEKAIIKTMFEPFVQDWDLPLEEIILRHGELTREAAFERLHKAGYTVVRNKNKAAEASEA